MMRSFLKRLILVWIAMTFVGLCVHEWNAPPIKPKPTPVAHHDTFWKDYMEKQQIETLLNDPTIPMWRDLRTGQAIYSR